VSRYRWDSFDGTRDAYDEGYRDRWTSNPHDRHGDHTEEERHRAFEDGRTDHRREEERREEREREEAEEHARMRRAAEGRAAEEEFYAQQEQQRYEPEPPTEESGPEPTE
jgi:hypothetical protein